MINTRPMSAGMLLALLAVSAAAQASTFKKIHIRHSTETLVVAIANSGFSAGYYRTGPHGKLHSFVLLSGRKGRRFRGAAEDRFRGQCHQR